MDAQIDRHQPLITARLVFKPKAFPPPPIISARMEFPSISVPQQYERSPTPEVRTPRRRSSTPKKRYTTPKRDDVDLKTRRAATPARRPTPINTQRAVAFQDDDDDISVDSPLTPTPEESEQDPAEDGEVSTKIPKPRGTVGRPQSGGYNLQDKLGWNDTTYQRILSLVHKLAKKRLNTVKSFSGQDMKKIGQICDAVRKEYPILKDYIRDWPTCDMLKLHLKYTSETARRSAIASTAKKIEEVLSKRPG